jgi:hypothetical protein
MEKNNPSELAPGQNKNHTIIVNTRPKEFVGQKITYDEVVQLAYPGEHQSEMTVFTVTYANPHGHDGSLASGEDVHVTEGMVFNVVKTNRS